jgi:hypothetical protein
VRWVAALGGALLAVALFLPFYTYDTARTEREALDALARGAGDGPANQPIVTFELRGEETVDSAWHLFSVIDLALAAVALLAVAAAFVPRLRLAAALAATAGVGLVLFRIADHSGADRFLDVSFYPSPAVGAWAALAGALIAAAAGWASLRRGS